MDATNNIDVARVLFKDHDLLSDFSFILIRPVHRHHFNSNAKPGLLVHATAYL